MKGVWVLVLLLVGVVVGEKSHFIRYPKDEPKPQQNDNVERILGGTDVPSGTFPFMVSILANGQIYCGATLISSQWALTAGHCFFNVSASLSVFKLCVGTVDVSNNCAQGTLLSIDKAVVHPDFFQSPDSQVCNALGVVKNDITLVRIKDPSQTPKNFVTLDQGIVASKHAGSTATVIGWGVTLSNNPSNILQQVDVPVVTNGVCATKMQPECVGIQTSEICAGGQLNKDSCQGDSGGPLLIVNGANVTQVGIVSFGVGCGQLGLFGIYERVADQKAFIDNTIATQSSAVLQYPILGLVVLLLAIVF